jgi:hypothetical protein
MSDDTTPMAVEGLLPNDTIVIDGVELVIEWIDRTPSKITVYADAGQVWSWPRGTLVQMRRHGR